MPVGRVCGASGASLFFRTPTDVKKKASGMPNDAKHHASGLADAVVK